MTRLTPFAGLIAAGLIALAAPLAAQSLDEIDTSGVVEMTQGEADAPVQVTEYSLFTCPYCAQFHEEYYPRLKSDYIDTGAVEFTYREAFFGQDPRPGLWPAIVARCAGPERYFGVVELIFDRQDQWTEATSYEDLLGQLRQIGLTAGLSGEEIDACFADNENAQAIYANWLQNNEEDQVTQTPTFFIDGERFQGDNWEQLFEQIDAAVAAAE